MSDTGNYLKGLQKSHATFNMQLAPQKGFRNLGPEAWNIEQHCINKCLSLHKLITVTRSQQFEAT